MEPPPSTRRPRAEREQQVRQAARGAESVKAIAEELGLSPTRIGQIINDLPDAPAIREVLRTNKDRAMHEHVRQAVRESTSLAALARALGLSAQYLLEIIGGMVDGDEIRRLLLTNSRIGTVSQQQRVREAANAYGSVDAIAKTTKLSPARVDRIIEAFDDAAAIRARMRANSTGNRRGKSSSEITAFGETKNAHAWSRDPRCQVTAEGLRSRLRAGMDAEEAITKPALPFRVPITDRGQHHLVLELRRRRLEAQVTVADLARHLGPAWNEPRLSSYELGRNRMTVDAASEIAGALGLELRLVETPGPAHPPDAQVDVRPLIPGRKAEVLALLALGLDVHKIAEQIGVTWLTVREYTKYIYNDLGAHTSGQAVALGVARGWITIEPKAYPAVSPS